jgi:DNA-binding NarL/FixJ family response regulator
MIRVSVFDDNKDLLEGIRLLLENSDTIFLAGTHAHARHAISDITKDRPDVVVMDIQMPGISGIDAVREVKNAFPNLQILMQTVFEDDDKVFAAICCGASGYILKDSSKKLLEAIQEVHAGGSPMSPPIARKVIQLFQQQFVQVQPDYQPLTAREKEILACLVKGNSYKMIAEDCFISVHTVHTHIKKIYDKLHVNSGSEAVAKAIRQHIV